MLAVVLVGGFGTRLRPLTLTTPKQMIVVGDRPMIEHVLDRLRRHGVDRAVLSMGYRPDAFWSAYPDDRYGGIELAYAVDPVPLDTGGAIRYAARSAGVDSTFVAVNGDVITNLDLSAQIEFHHRVAAEATLHLTPVEDPSRFGVVPTDEGGLVRGFIEKPPAGEAPSNMINAGTYVMEPGVLDTIPEGRPVSIEREIFPALVERRGLYGFVDDSYWVDAGTPESYLRVVLDLAAGRWGSPTGFTTFEGSVVAPTATILEGAVVRDSVVLDDAVIGAGAVVDRSIIGRRARVGEDAVVTDLTVVGDDAVVESGAHLSGARVPDVDDDNGDRLPTE